MTTIIAINKQTWIAKGFTLVFATFVITVMLFTVPWPKTISIVSLMPFIFALGLVSLWVNVFLDIRFMPKSALLDTDAKLIEGKYFFRPSKIIYLDEIESLYSNFIQAGRSENSKYEGVMVCLKNGEKLLFSEYYIADHTDIYLYLRNADIPDIGEQYFNKYAYCWDSYKASKKAA